MKMVKLKVRIEGISPLLQRRFPDPGTGKTKIKDQSKNQDDVQSYLYKDEKGQIVQPSIHLIRSLMKAGAKFQIPGRRRETYKNLMGCGVVIIYPDMIPHVFQDWEIFRAPVVIQKARIMRERPCFKKWALEFVVDMDIDEIPAAAFKEIMDYAGRYVGIGDFRPEKSGSFGRFMVTEFKET